MSKPYNELTDEEITDLEVANENTYLILSKGVRKLRKRRPYAVNEEEMAGIDVKIADLRKKIALHDAKIIAMDAGNHIIKPPSDALLANLGRLLGQVEALNRHDAILSKVIDLTNEGLATYKRITNP